MVFGRITRCMTLKDTSALEVTGRGDKMKPFFTQTEIHLMMDHNVPRELAYVRIKSGLWDRQAALTTEVLKGKNVKRKNQK